MIKIEQSCMSSKREHAYNFNMQKKIKSVYIIGIGGISLSAIAVFLKEQGYIVYGSDTNDSEIIHNLIKEGFSIKIGDASDYVEMADMIIYTSAVSKTNSDLRLAQKLGKPIFSRSQILGEISKKYKTISVAGTHGKTTTTGMISSIFLTANKKPNIHIGGILRNINSNVLVNSSNIFITEACEYKDSFLQLKNYVSVVLNIHEDHLDYFKDLNQITDSFNIFAQNTVKNGYYIYNFDDLLAKNIDCKCKKISFGFCDDCDLQAININECENGKYSFGVKFHGNYLGEIYLPCFGKHNIYNALASIAVGIAFNIKFENMKLGIENFKGIKRRFELVGKFNGNLIIHDYAHHPDEINATIKTCRELGYKKVIVVFQPHTFSRTQTLKNEFLDCLKKSDETWLLPIYPAREKPIKGVSSFGLAKQLKKDGYKMKYFSNFKKCKDSIISYKESNTIFAILGAGDIENLADMLK